MFVWKGQLSDNDNTCISYHVVLVGVQVDTATRVRPHTSHAAEYEARVARAAVRFGVRARVSLVQTSARGRACRDTVAVMHVRSAVNL